VLILVVPVHVAAVGAAIVVGAILAVEARIVFAFRAVGEIL